MKIVGCDLQGFARRSGMKVRTEFAPPAERLPNSIETALFRVLQESLTNVH
jgi:signal transduction histidine kinase